MDFLRVPLCHYYVRVYQQTEIRYRFGDEIRESRSSVVCDFRVTVKGTIENIFNLSEEQLKSRTVQHYDVCDAYKSEVIPDNEVLICKGIITL